MERRVRNKFMWLRIGTNFYGAGGGGHLHKLCDYWLLSSEVGLCSRGSVTKLFKYTSQFVMRLAIRKKQTNALTWSSHYSFTSCTSWKQKSTSWMRNYSRKENTFSHHTSPTIYMALNVVTTWVLPLIRILRCRRVAILPLMFRNFPHFLQQPSGYYLQQDRFLQRAF